MARPMTTGWFVERQGGVRGPYTRDELKALGQRGQVKPDDFIRHGLNGRPVPAPNFKGLFPSTPTRSDEPPAESAPPTPNADEPSGADDASAAAERSVADESSFTVPPFTVPPFKVPPYSVPPSEEEALLTAKRRERLRIAQFCLPQSYLDLGKAVHSAQTHQNIFPGLHAQIDASFHRIRGARSTDDSSSGRPKLVAATPRNAAAAKPVFHKLAGQFRSLGKAAFEKDGQASGPAHLTSAIAEHHRQIETLDAEIAAIEPHASRVITPRRVLVGAVCALGLLLLSFGAFRNGIIASIRESVAGQSSASDQTASDNLGSPLQANGGSGSAFAAGALLPRTDVAKMMPDSAKSEFQENDLKELIATARNGVAGSRMQKLRRQRSSENYAGLVQEVNSFKNGTIGCPRDWIDMYWMWKGRYVCLEGLNVHVLEVTGPTEFVAEGFSAETSGKRVVLRGWDTTGLVEDQRRSLSGVGYSAGKPVTYGTIGASKTGFLIEKVPGEIVRYVVDALLKPAPK
jgi:hypothetical protein